jgi:hypothetical protein
LRAWQGSHTVVLDSVEAPREWYYSDAYQQAAMLGLGVLHDLPGLGANPEDHLLMTIAFHASTPIPTATSNHGEASV